MKIVLALGFFDGLHRGHGALLRTARQRADELGCRAALLSFDTHPDLLVHGQTVPLINTPRDRALMARELFGMDEVLICHFDRAMMELPWERFVDECLAAQYGAVHVVCGANFRFGHRGQGTPERLQARCAAMGIGCDVVSDVTLDGVTVSSTYIRRLLQSGQLERANRFLGHPHQLTEVVCSGRKLGRTLGIPTANLHLPEGILQPAFGVYASTVQIGGRRFAAVTNIGTRPTVGGQDVTVEPWILDFDGDLYQQEITVRFYRFLRPEQKFASLEELKAAIFRNADQTRAYFATKKEI